MAARTWDKDRAAKRIDARIAELPIGDIKIKKFVRDTDLTSLARDVAYRVHCGERAALGQHVLPPRLS